MCRRERVQFQEKLTSRGSDLTRPVPGVSRPGGRDLIPSRGSDLIPILFGRTDCVQPIVFEGAGKKLETRSDPDRPSRSDPDRPSNLTRRVERDLPATATLRADLAAIEDLLQAKTKKKVDPGRLPDASKG